MPCAILRGGWWHMPLTNSDIARLIECTKRITEAPRRDMIEEGGHRRNDFKCQSVAEDSRFRVFIRQNTTFPENFSIGMAYLHPEDGEVILIRCNGPHGTVVADPLRPGSDRHFEFHIHLAKEENIEAGLLPEAGGTPTSEYGTLDDALRYFVRTCGIDGAERYFPLLANPTLF